MNSIDLVSAAAVLLAAVAGAVSGLLPQLGRLASIAAGWAGARWAAPSLAPRLHGSVPAFAEGAVATMLAFVGCAVAARVALWIVLGVTGLRRASGGGADRGLGALVGGAQAGVVVWVVASALGAWNRPIGLGSARLDPTRSEVVALARDHSALGRWAGDDRERARRGARERSRASGPRAAP